MNTAWKVVAQWWWVILLWGPAAAAGLPVHTNQITLAWDASPDVQVKGSYLYISTQSGCYDYRHNASNSLSHEVTGLIPRTTYYFMVTAYDADGMESDPSNEVGYTVPEEGTQAPAEASYQQGNVATGDIGGLRKLPEGEAQVTFATVVGKTYRVWATTSFRDWELVETVTAVSVATQVQDPSAGGHPSRFYRIELAP